MDPEHLLRVRLAVLFGCPIWMVGNIVPASELPIWHAHYKREPWGFNAQDMLSSKSSYQSAMLQGKLNSGATYRDFMFSDPYQSLSLTKEQYEALSEEEQLDYVRRQVNAAKQVPN